MLLVGSRLFLNELVEELIVRTASLALSRVLNDRKLVAKCLPI
jgi:hypothetical protein